MIEIQKRPYLINWSGNAIYYEMYSAYAAANSGVTFEVKIKFMHTNESLYEDVIILPFTPVAGRVLFDIKDIIDAQLSFDMPNFVDNDWICYNQSGYFYIEFREITPDNLTPAWITTENMAQRVCVKGGIHPYHYKGNNFWLNHYPTALTFFTWKPQGQLVQSTEQTWLAFFYTGEELIVKGELQLIYKDGTIVTFTRDINVDLYCTTLFQTNLFYGWDNGAGFDDENVYQWKVRIRDFANTVTLVNWHTYELDNRQDYNETILHYRNSIGGLDNVRVRGVIEKKLNYETQQAELILPTDYFNNQVLPGQQKTVGSSENVIYSGEVGFVSKAEQESLRDIFMYREVYQHKIARWWPLILLTDDFLLKKSTDMRWSIPIEWKVALTAINHYNEEGTDFGEGVNTSNVCLATMTASEASRVFINANTEVQITVNKSIATNPQALTITQFQWWTDYDTTVTTQLLSAPMVVTLPEGGDYFIFLRALAPDGSFGPVFSFVVNTDFSGPPPPPGPNNSTITIPYVTTFKIKRNGVRISIGVSDGVTPVAFYCADGTGLTIDVSFFQAAPVNGTIESNLVIYNLSSASFVPPDENILTWNAVDSVSGMTILIS